MSSKPIKKGTLSSSRSKAFAFIAGEVVFSSTKIKVISPNFPEILPPPIPCSSLAFARMRRVAARGGMTTGDRGVARGAPDLVRRQRLWPTVSAGLLRHSSQKGYEGRVTLSTADGKTGGFGGVPLGFATDAPRGSAGSFTFMGEDPVCFAFAPN